MDFSVPDPTRELLSEIRQFVHEELYPLEELARGQTFGQIEAALQEKRRLVQQRGWWLPQLPRQQGGLGLSLLDYAMISEELGRSPYGHYAFNAQAPDAGNMEILIEYGTPAQQEDWLQPLLAGKVRSCFSMTEPDRAGSNPVWMDTTAERDGDEYVICGRKWFTTAADGAEFAIVMAITNPDAEPHRRASQIIVPTKQAGFQLVRNIPCMGHTGDGWLSHSEIAYEDCRVPVANRLGGEGEGFAIAQSRLAPGRIHHCMRWIGVAERCFDMLCQRAASREVRPGETLSTRQAIRHWIADSRAEIDAARLMVLRTAWSIDQVGARAARSEISAIKFFVAAVMEKAIDRAIQVHGALGFSDDTVLSTFYRNERAARIYDGPDEVHRDVVARHVLRQYEAKA